MTDVKALLAEIEAGLGATTEGPWDIQWYTCRADADDVRYEKTRKLKRGEKRRHLMIGDALWRLPISIGPIAPDHDHWAKDHLSAEEADARHVARCCPTNMAALVKYVRELEEKLEARDGA